MKKTEKELEQQRKWRENNKERIKEYRKKYNEENKEKIKESVRNYKTNNKERIRRFRKGEKKRNRDKYVVRDQTTWKHPKAEVCSKCGSKEKIEHHHNTIPYHVDKFVDLCSKCHRKEHKK